MDAETPYEDLITRYLLNEASSVEQQIIIDWMESDEKNRLVVENLRKTLNLIAFNQDLNKIDINKEWEKSRANILEIQQQVVTLNQFDEYEWQSSDEEKRRQRGKIYKIIISTAVAASILMIIGVTNGWFTKNDRRENPIDQQAQGPKEGSKIDPLMAVVQHEVNTSGKIKKLLSPDGSEIDLYDGCEITYKEPVGANRRDVYLIGKANFRVAKNKEKPFTVFSGDISTTALGTIFTVTARQTEKLIVVRLEEGKVVVKPLKGYSKNWPKDFYLSPGQELVFDKSEQTVNVKSFAGQVATNRRTQSAKDSPDIPKYDNRSWFMFNNQPLSEIFDALAVMYNVRIVYSKEDVKDRYHIGTYDKSDSLETILNKIALLNKLQITKLNSGYKIQKKRLKK
ncbi:MAG TPA: FecR domain-containing protein [Flavitalea sp.]|nr:FecR domain-containing protein [Flavitalea sp.]